MVIKLNVKPLSVNQVWQGKRFKTPKYKAYEKELLLLLPNDYKVPLKPLEITLKFGFSSKLSDWDNPIKPFQDILQKKYKFNDSQIYKAIVIKEIVKKGDEFIEFEINEIE
jgi:Holliday junction resolvase RusA-like endonuclease